MAIPQFEPKRLFGVEKIIGTDAIIADYWSWAHSVFDNIERSRFAEFLVHKAMGATSQTYSNWDSYDIISPEGIKIEVKASAYLQSWGQKELSKISFNIEPKKSWTPETNTYEEKATRPSNVYVFCLHNHKEQETSNILDTKQWIFFVLPTDVLNAKIPEQKTISLNSLKNLNPQETDYSGLRNTVLRAVNFL